MLHFVSSQTTNQFDLLYRLANLQGPSFGFFGALYAFASLPEMKCNSNANEHVSDEDYLNKLRMVIFYFFKKKMLWLALLMAQALSDDHRVVVRCIVEKKNT